MPGKTALPRASAITHPAGHHCRSVRRGRASNRLPYQETPPPESSQPSPDYATFSFNASKPPSSQYRLSARGAKRGRQTRLPARTGGAGRGLRPQPQGPRQNGCRPCRTLSAHAAKRLRLDCFSTQPAGWNHPIGERCQQLAAMYIPRRIPQTSFKPHTPQAQNRAAQQDGLQPRKLYQSCSPRSTKRGRRSTGSTRCSCTSGCRWSRREGSRWSRTDAPSAPIRACRRHR